jgi:beta-lactamase superfamily II metal-dependent hydrolase
MPQEHVIAVDMARVFASATGRELVTTLVWGDPVEVAQVTPEHVEIRLPPFPGDPGPQRSGFIRPTDASRIKTTDVVVARAGHRVLKVDFVDVQQGDGCAIETPAGKVVLIDGGDNPLFARYLAGRFRDSRPDRPQEVDCLLVSHGDADHFVGLCEILESEDHPTPGKRIFIRPRRVYHNGLVKRPTRRDGHAVPEAAQLGATTKVGDQTIITGLEDDLLGVADAEMNAPFQRWKRTLATWNARTPITFRRLALGDDDAFAFLADEGIKARVLGPIPTSAGAVSGLPFLGQPRPGPRLGHDSVDLDNSGFRGLSASHTINGHSVVLRLTYGSFNFLFTGDLNDQAARSLTAAHNRGDLSVRAEVFKVPHHGSAEFSGAFLQAVAPVVSVVSSGDENARKEYIHPRATLMGALGRYSRVEEPLVFVTELVAFFQVEGQTTPEQHILKDGELKPDPRAKPPFFAFSRAEFGLVKVRSDGDRMLVVTNSGLHRLKEAYAYRPDELGLIVPAPIRVA